MRSSINRALSWLKTVMEIKEETNVPDVLLENVQPTIDVFGWERFPEIRHVRATGNGAIVFINSETAPEGFVRYVMNCSLQHTDPVNSHVLWLTKRIRGSSNAVGLGTDTSKDLNINRDRDISMLRPTFLMPGDVIVANISLVLTSGGSLNLDMAFVDIPVGEYVRAM